MKNKIISLICSFVMLLTLYPAGVYAVDEESSDVNENQIIDVSDDTNDISNNKNDLTTDNTENTVTEHASNNEDDVVAELQESTDTSVYTGTFGENIIWSLNIETGELLVSGTGKMKDIDYVTSSSDPLKNLRKYIKSAVIEDGITDIGENNFKSCSELIEVKFPNTLENIGESAFEGLNMTKIEFPSTLKNIGKSAFTRSDLTEITFPNTVESIGNSAFYDCENLETVYFEGDAPQLGSGCFDHSHANYDYLFTIVYNAGNSGFSTPTWNGYSCALAEQISDYSTLNKDDRNAQGIIFKLNSVSNTATVGVNTTKKNNSKYCGGQDGEVTIPDTVTKDGVSYSVIGINQYAFYDCPWIRTVYLGKNLSAIEPSAFQDCDKLTRFMVDKYNQQYADYDGVLYDHEGLYLYAYPAGKDDEEYTVIDSCTTVGTKSFSGASKLKSIVLTDNIINIGAAAFQGCNGIVDITLPFIGGSIDDDNPAAYVFNVDSYGNYYWPYKSNLKSITLLKGNLKAGAFRGAKDLEEICINDCTNITDIPHECFTACVNLERLIFGGDKDEVDYNAVILPNTVTGIGWDAFSDCDKLKSFVIPDSVKDIDDTAFSDCNGIENFSVVSSSKYFDSDKFGALYDKGMNELLFYPPARKWPYYNVNENTKNIRRNAFVDCENLVNVFIPENVSKLEDRSIYDCPGTTLCVYKNSAAAKYAVSNGLTAWYMDNYKMQGIRISNLPEQSIVDRSLLNSDDLYVTALYGDKELQVDDYEVIMPSRSGLQTLTVKSGGFIAEAPVVAYDSGSEVTETFTNVVNNDISNIFAALYDNKGKLLRTSNANVIDGNTTFIFNKSEYNKATKIKLFGLNKKYASAIGNCIERNI